MFDPGVSQIHSLLIGLHMNSVQSRLLVRSGIKGSYFIRSVYQILEQERINTSHAWRKGCTSTSRKWNRMLYNERVGLIKGCRRMAFELSQSYPQSYSFVSGRLRFRFSLMLEQSALPSLAFCDDAIIAVGDADHVVRLILKHLPRRCQKQHLYERMLKVAVHVVRGTKGQTLVKTLKRVSDDMLKLSLTLTSGGLQ